MRSIIAAAVFLLPAAASAGAARSISWFMAHPTEMRQTIAACQDSSELANTATCINAEAAAAGLRARATAGPRDLVAMLSDPRYWSANPIARDGELVNCRNGTSMLPQFCRAAAQSAMQDRSR